MKYICFLILLFSILNLVISQNKIEKSYDVVVSNHLK